MENHWVSSFLMERRFRRRLKSKRKKQQRERIRSAEVKLERKYKSISSNIKSYQDALQYFLPRNLAYLIFIAKNSPFYVDRLKKEEYKDYKYDVLTDNEYITFKYFKNIQNDNSAFFDKYRKNWLHILSDDRGENLNRSSVYPTVAEEMNAKMDEIMKNFKSDRRGMNEEYYK